MKPDLVTGSPSFGWLRREGSSGSGSVVLLLVTGTETFSVFHRRSLSSRSTIIHLLSIRSTTTPPLVVSVDLQDISAQVIFIVLPPTPPATQKNQVPPASLETIFSVSRRHSAPVSELGQIPLKERHRLISHWAWPINNFSLLCSMGSYGRHSLISYWAWPINNFSLLSSMGSYGSWPIWRFYLVCPNFRMMLVFHLLKCRHQVRLLPPPLLVSPTNSSVRVGDSTKANQDASSPLYLSSSCRVQERSLPSSSCLKEIVIRLLCISLRTGESNSLFLVICLLPRYQNSSCQGQREIILVICLLPRYQNSSCRGQREIVLVICLLPRYQNSSCRGQREIVFPILLNLEGDSSETLLSDIFKGSANWCFVTPAKVADIMIVISVLVTVSIAKSRSLLVLFASQGLVSLTSSKIVKVRRLHDFYGLSVKIACIYPFIFYACVFRLPFEAAMVVLSSVVTNSSFYGEG